MKCPSCGKDIANDAKFCRYCGAKLNPETVTLEQGNGENPTAPESVSAPHAFDNKGGGAPAQNNAEQAETPDATSDAIPTTAKDSTSATKHVSNRKRIIAIAASVIVVVVAILGITFFQQYSAEQAQRAIDAIDAERISEDLSENESFMAGAASNDYVDEDAYDLDSFELDDKSVDDGTMTILGTYEISNKFFDEAGEIEITYLNNGGSWALDTAERVDYVITPLRGITNDPNAGFSDVESTFDPDTKTSTYRGEGEARDEWYGTAEEAPSYVYTFMANGWASSTEIVHTYPTSFSKVEGTYTDTREKDFNEHGTFNSFAVKDFKIATNDKGEDTITCTVTCNWTSAYETYSIGIVTGPLIKEDENGDPVQYLANIEQEGTVSIEDGAIVITLDPGYGEGPVRQYMNLIKGTVTLRENGDADLDGSIYSGSTLIDGERKVKEGSLDGVTLHRAQ